MQVINFYIIPSSSGQSGEKGTPSRKVYIVSNIVLTLVAGHSTAQHGMLDFANVN